MPYIPELSGDQIFWELVKKKIEIVPDLIELLSDSTQTDAVVPNFGGFYSVGDIAYFIIAEIIHGTPTRSFVPQKSDDEGFYYYWNYVRSDYSNRVQFKQKVSKWFEENKNSLKWVDDSMKYKTSSDWKYPTSFHPSGGYYKIKD